MLRNEITSWYVKKQKFIHHLEVMVYNHETNLNKIPAVTFKTSTLEKNIN